VIRCFRIERRAVEGVFAQDAKRDLIGDRLADQRGAGIEQRLNGPCVLVGHRMPARPVMIAASRRLACDIEEVLGGEGETRERPA
jgi:hypothetical protein